MRTLWMGGWLVLAALLAMPLWAEEGDQGDRPGRNRDPERRQRILDQFDADGNGELDETERATAREAMRERRARRGDGGPQEGRPEGWRRGSPHGPEGTPPRGPGGPPPELAPEALFERFDKDGDDMLSREEFMALAREVRRIREEMRPPFAGPRGRPPFDADRERPEGRRGDPRRGFGRDTPGERPAPDAEKEAEPTPEP